MSSTCRVGLGVVQLMRSRRHGRDSGGLAGHSGVVATGGSREASDRKGVVWLSTWAAVAIKQ